MRECDDDIDRGMSIVFVSKFAMVEGRSSRGMAVDKEQIRWMRLQLRTIDKEEGATVRREMLQNSEFGILSWEDMIAIECRFYKPVKRCVNLVEAIPP